MLFRLSPELYLTPGENYTPFDVGPDGRFLMARQVRVALERPAPLVVVENWLEELKRLTAR